MTRLFLFDIDGTLMRAGTRVHRDSFAHAFQTVYSQPLSLDGISAAGRTDTWLLAEPLRRIGMPDDEIWGRMPEAFAAMEAYVDEHLDDLRPCVLPGVHEVLGGLQNQGGHLGLLTGNLRRVAMAKLGHAGLAAYFETGGFGEESETRAHLVPVALENAAEMVGHEIPPHQAVVIGDTPFDIEAGKIGGTRTAGVATGPYSEADLRAASADLVLPSFEDAAQAVEELLTVSG